MTQRDKRMLIVLGTIVVLALGFLFLKSRGSGGSSATPAPAALAGPASPTPVPSPTRTKADSKAAPLTEGRDPFVNLFPPPPPPASSAPPVDVSPTPSASPTPSPSATTTPTTPSGGSTATIGDKTVTLLSIFTDGGTKFVHVKVDDTRYDAEEGATFDQGYQVTTIEDPCADFTWQTDSFRLCTTPPSGN